jgi:hypothetical protein
MILSGGVAKWEGSGLQNLDSRVRFAPSPPISAFAKNAFAKKAKKPMNDLLTVERGGQRSTAFPFGYAEVTSIMAESKEAMATAEINQLHQEIIGAARTSLAKAIRIGELLAEQKANLEHGQWLPWIKKRFSDETLQRYMRVYRNREELKSASVTDLAHVYRLLNGSNGEKAQPQPELTKVAPEGGKAEERTSRLNPEVSSGEDDRVAAASQLVEPEPKQKLDAEPTNFEISYILEDLAQSDPKLTATEIKPILESLGKWVADVYQKFEMPLKTVHHIIGAFADLHDQLYFFSTDEHIPRTRNLLVTGDKHARNGSYRERRLLEDALLKGSPQRRWQTNF